MQFLNLLRQQRDLIQIETGDVAHRIGKIDRVVVDQADNGFQICRALGYDQPELGQGTAQGVDQLRTLTDKGLMRPESDGTSLVLGALHGHVMQVWA